jgi:hypothetical protein
MPLKTMFDPGYRIEDMDWIWRLTALDPVPKYVLEERFTIRATLDDVRVFTHQYEWTAADTGATQLPIVRNAEHDGSPDPVLLTAGAMVYEPPVSWIFIYLGGPLAPGDMRSLAIDQLFVDPRNNTAPYAYYRVKPFGPHRQLRLTVVLPVECVRTGLKLRYSDREAEVMTVGRWVPKDGVGAVDVSIGSATVSATGAIVTCTWTLTRPQAGQRFEIRYERPLTPEERRDYDAFHIGELIMGGSDGG